MMNKYFSLTAGFLASMLALEASSISSSICSTKKPDDCCPLPPKRECCCIYADVCKPCGVTLGAYAQVLFAQPNASNIYYGAQAIGRDTSISVPAASPNWVILEINPDYHLGFDVSAYAVGNNPNVTFCLDWERLYTKDTASFTASSVAGDMVGPISDIGPLAVPYKIASSCLTFDFDQVDLTIGKRYSICNDFGLHIYGGLGFVHIGQSLDSTYSNVDSTIVRKINTDTRYLGIGPELNFKYLFRFGDQMYLTGSSLFSLYIGRMKDTVEYQSFTPELSTLGIPQPNIQTTKIPHRSQVIPGFEQRVGISSAIACSCTKIIIEFGYLCQIYVNAIQSIDMTAPQVLPESATFTAQVGEFAVGFERTLSNFMVNGLYVTLGFEY